MKKLLKTITGEIYLLTRNLFYGRSLLLIAALYLLSVFTALGLLPFLWQKKEVVFLVNGDTDFYVPLTAIFIAVLILSWNLMKITIRKWRATKALCEVPLTYLDTIGLFIFMTSFVFLMSHKQVSLSYSADFFDFAVSTVVLFMVWLASGYTAALLVKDNQKEVKSSKPTPFSDEPIDSLEHDLIGRKQFVEQLQKEIVGLESKGSFVFGVHGEWGEGKSSVAHMLMRELKKDESFIIVDYEPWSFKDQDAMLKGFYEQIRSAISKRYILSGIKSTITKYRKAISAGSSYTFGLSLDWLPVESFQEIRDRLCNYLCLTGHKIVIFIDEIDRLKADEIQQIFKLVRANTRFKNTIFVLSFDPVAIRNELGDNIDKEYLEKMVDKPIQLPPATNDIQENFLYNGLLELCKELGISEEKYEESLKEFFNFYWRSTPGLFKNLRKVKRYLNSLRSSLPPMFNEVNLYDFLLLELVKVFYDEVYKDIWHNWTIYTEAEWSEDSYQSMRIAFMDDDERREEVTNHITQVFDKIPNGKNRKIVQEILTSVFPSVESVLENRKTNVNRGRYRRMAKAAHPGCFRKYFAFNVPTTDISDELIRNALQSWSEEEDSVVEESIKNQFKKLQDSDNLMRFLKVLLNYTKEEITESIALKIVRTIYKNVELFSQKGRDDLWNSEYDKAMALMMWLINDSIPKNKIENLVLEMISSTENFDFATEAVRHCKKEQGGSLYNIYESVDILKVQTALAKRLKKHFVDQNLNIFEELQKWQFVLYQWATNLRTNDENQSTVKAYLVQLFDSSPESFTKLVKASRGTAIAKEFDIDDELKPSLVPQGFDFSGVIGYLFNNQELLLLAEKAVAVTAITDEDKKLIEEFIAHVKNLIAGESQQE